MIAYDGEEDIGLCGRVYKSLVMSTLSAGSVAFTTYFWQDKDDAWSIGLDAFLILTDFVTISFTGLVIYDTALHCRGIGAYAIHPDIEMG